MAAVDEDSLDLKTGEADQPYQLILLYGPISETLQALNRAMLQECRELLLTRQSQIRGA